MPSSKKRSTIATNGSSTEPSWLIGKRSSRAISQPIPSSDENKKAGKDGGSGDKPTAPNLDLALEALVEVLDGKRTVHFHSHRADDIRTTLRLKDEFKFDLVIQHGTEGYRVAKEIAERKVYVSMTIPDSPGGKAEVADFIEACGAEMTKAGVKVMINTDDPVTESRFLLRTAAISVRGGLSEEDALKGLTIYPAQAMHVDHKVGSLESGKDADFVVLSGSPFSVYARVMQTYIDGRKVFELADEHDRRYQQGGHALSNKVPFPAQNRSLLPCSRRTISRSRQNVRTGGW